MKKFFKSLIEKTVSRFQDIIWFLHIRLNLFSERTLAKFGIFTNL